MLFLACQCSLGHIDAHFLVLTAEHSATVTYAMHNRVAGGDIIYTALQWHNANTRCAASADAASADSGPGQVGSLAGSPAANLSLASGNNGKPVGDVPSVSHQPEAQVDPQVVGPERSVSEGALATAAANQLDGCAGRSLQPQAPSQGMAPGISLFQPEAPTRPSEAGSHVGIGQPEESACDIGVVASDRRADASTHGEHQVLLVTPSATGSGGHSSPAAHHASDALASDNECGGAVVAASDFEFEVASPDHTIIPGDAVLAFVIAVWKSNSKESHGPVRSWRAVRMRLCP